MEFTMDQFSRINAKLDTVLAEAGEMRTEQAVASQALGHIRQHLDKLNGRTGKSEDRLSILETMEAERRGAWKLMLIIASLPASVIAGIAVWIAQHK